MAKLFITGGAGFLGRALTEHFQDVWDMEVTVYSRDEAKHAKARSQFPDVNFIMGDILDTQRLWAAVAGHDYVIHAAAMKHVPQAETNVRECTRINIDGSRNVFDASVFQSVRSVVSISTDKACRPVNVYGYTKKIMERLAQEYATYGGTAFKTVRYGNVIASTGSVIPIFQKQARERVLRITDPNMTRFWLSIQEAVGLVEHALMKQTSGTILVARLAACDMVTVAKAAAKIELGDEYEEDRLDFQTIGDRFGEKVHEELVAPEEVKHARDMGDGHIEISPIWKEPIVDMVDPYSQYYTSAMPDQGLGVDDMVELIRYSLGDELPD